MLYSELVLALFTSRTGIILKYKIYMARKLVNCMVKVEQHTCSYKVNTHHVTLFQVQINLSESPLDAHVATVQSVDRTLAACRQAISL